MDDREMKMSMIAELEKQKEQLCAALDGRIAELKNELIFTDNMVGKFFKDNCDVLYVVRERIEIDEGDVVYGITIFDRDNSQYIDTDIYGIAELNDKTEITQTEAKRLFRLMCKQISRDIFVEDDIYEEF